MTEDLASPIPGVIFLRLLLAMVPKGDTKTGLCDFIGLMDLRIK